MAKQSPPMPQEVGSTKPRTALVATAASMAGRLFEDLDGGLGGGKGWAVPAAPLRPMAAGGMRAGSGDAVASVDVGTVEFSSACWLEFGRCF